VSWFEGTSVQNAIYLGGAEWPITHGDWEARAQEAIDAPAFGYIAGGAGAELTMRANREAFERVRLKPRMLAGNRERDLSVEVLGTRSPAPFLLAPIGVLSIAHAEGELACARAAAATGVPFVLSSAASHSLEEVAAAMGDAPRWFQLYWINDREVVASFVSRAAAAGYGAIVLTLDTLILGWRPRDLANAYLPFVTGAGCAQFFSDPVFCARLQQPPADDVLTAAATMLATFPNLGLTWDDLKWLREQVELPLLVKGVLAAEDAQRAFDCGVDGVIVSNHGGRQVDGAIGALDAFAEVRAAVGDDRTVLVDGGVRTGADVLKAMALGADAVLVGRPYAYGLAAGGQAGVEAVIRQLLAEVDITLALVGGHSARGLDRSFVVSPRRAP
jgi:lactate 2-monooxygenase